jgi:hypothetical protein
MSKARSNPSPKGAPGAANPQSDSHLTHVDLTWIKGRIEHWIRFGKTAAETVHDAERRFVSFAPGSVFAFIRWASNDFGTVQSRIDIIRAVHSGAGYQTVPFVRPGGELLLHLDGWPQVERVLQTVDIIEALGIDPVEVAPDHWRHLHNRLTAGHQPRAYSLAAHHAWLLRRRVRS